MKHLDIIFKYAVNKVKSLKIKKKITVIITSLIVLAGFSSFIVLQLALNLYNNKLVDDSSQTLNLYSSGIENELKRIDGNILTTLTSNQTQSSLIAINNSSTTPYQKFLDIENLCSFLLSQSETESYISSISIENLSGQIYTVGEDPVTFPQNLQKKIDAEVSQSNTIKWFGPQGSDGDIVAVREVRNLANMKMLGYIIYRIDPNELISHVSSVFPQYNAHLLIFSGQKLIYRDSDSKSIKFGRMAVYNAQNGICNIGGSKYLINREVSDYTNWTYVYLESDQYVFSNLNIMRLILIFSYLLILIIVLSVGLKIANGITKPIVTLSGKMIKIKDANFETSDMAILPDEICDEVGRLNNAFIFMSNKIDYLIKENYTKQILMKETQLKALQAQINPHFLYNTLDSVNWIAKANRQDLISTMIMSLGNLLRNSINNKKSLIKISEELHLLQDYITIQKVRYGDRLDFHLDISEDLTDYEIPKLTLQPIVENSIKYVLEKITGVCEITIEARKFSEHLEISVRDNGTGIDPDLPQKLNSPDYEHKGTGIGLQNINERLKFFFGDDCGLTIPDTKGEGALVIIKIPYIGGSKGVQDPGSGR